MKVIKVTRARENIHQLIKKVNEINEPVLITSKSGNAYLVSDADWNALQESVYLASIPRMSKKISEGINAPIEDCIDEKEITWQSIP